MAFVSLALILALSSTLAHSEERPNFVIILADDLGWADIGIQDEEATRDIVSPNIDKLFRSGLRFANGYVANATCGPSRASMMTGRTSSRFMMENNNELGVPTSELIIPEVLRKVGYTSGVFGKWHLGHEAGQKPWERGIDEFYGFLGGNHDYFEASIGGKNNRAAFQHSIGDVVSEAGWGGRGSDEYITDVLADKCVEFIGANKDEPFFMFASFNAPHSPMQAPQRYIEEVVKHQPRFEPVYEEIKLIKGRGALPKFTMSDFRSPDADPDVMRLVYCAMVAGLDDGVGRIMAAIDEAGIRENTLVVFLSDNGAALARPTDFGGVNLPMRHGKGTVFEGGVRVVFGASWPGVIPAGGDFDGIVSSTDLFTTAVELAGERIPNDRVIDGVNLIPYLTGEKEGNPHEHFFFRRKDQNSWSLRSGDFKWVKDRRLGRKSESALYRISKDASESNDVSAQYPEKKEELIRLYERMTKDLPDPL